MARDDAGAPPPRFSFRRPRLGLSREGPLEASSFLPARTFLPSAKQQSAVSIRSDASRQVSIVEGHHSSISIHLGERRLAAGDKVGVLFNQSVNNPTFRLTWRIEYDSPAV